MSAAVRSGRGIRRSWLVGWALALGAVLLSGCGTRLPASAFSHGQAGSPAGAATGATDVGVSATELRVGMIDSVSSPLGAAAFSGPMYGARAYFDALNARGGVNGHRIVVYPCDDAGTGAQNQSCVHQLIDGDHVFAFAGNSVYDYAGASYVNAKDVPDIGGEPITNAYDQYQHLYSIYGSDYPRDGTVGWGGRLWGGTEVYRWVRTHLHAHVAGIVYYNQESSQSYARSVAQGLRAEGFTVVNEQVDFALPDFQSAALDMRAHGVQVLFDAIDTGGNAQLCQAVDAAGLDLKAKVTTVQSWNASVRATYQGAPRCRDVLYATSSDRNYEDTGDPAVAAFRSAMARYYPGSGTAAATASQAGGQQSADQLSEWELEGWVSAMWLTDAVRSCGSDITRACVERFMDRGQGYDADGLIIPARFAASRPGATARDCLDVARWQDSADGGRGGWVTQTPNMDATCYTVPVLWYSP